MFKLTVVGGPTRGQSFKVADGETSIGRVPGNDIVLVSQRVSKSHCVLVVNNSEVTVKDNGSSNGTFVNGVLTKLRKLMPGDRVSVGEYILELTKVEAAKAAMPVLLEGQDNVLPFRAPGAVLSAGIDAVAVPAGSPDGAAASTTLPAEPADLKEKITFLFEKYILNFVYNLNEKHEWKSMVSGMIAVLTLGGAALSVYPVLDRVQEKLAQEAEGRALMLSRQIVDRNAAFIYEKLDSKVDIGFAEKEPGVIAAYLIDMDGRVMAPGRKLNQYLTEANEAAFSASMRQNFAKKESLERKAVVYGDMVAVATPLKIFSAAAGKNVTVALGLVFFDRTQILFDSSTEAMAYIQAIILSAILGVIIYFSLYRLTLRPLAALNEDVDQVLKGNASVVSKRYRMEEIDPLIDVINAALQRASGGSGQGGAMGVVETVSVDELLGSLKFAADRMTSIGMMIFTPDRKIAHINAFMEEVSGIRLDSAMGSDIGSVARDAAFAAFVEDILGRAPASGSEPLSEDFEFSGTNYKMECVGVGQPGSARLYTLTAAKVE